MHGDVYEDGGMERELLLRLERVGRRYGFRGDWILRGLDLEIAAGALIRVEGANGTGSRRCSGSSPGSTPPPRAG